MKRNLAAFTLVAVLLTGCHSVYYKTMEKVGYHKREILVDRVEDARESQEEAQEQFQSALEQFRSVVEFDGGELERQYDKLNSEYEKSVNAADNFRDRIKKIESVAEALFAEWEAELNEYTSPALRRDSESKLQDTRARYKELLRALNSAESKMDPVLAILKDNVLYLKHNLNAKAVGQLKGEFAGVKRNIDLLIAEMNRAIAESNKFIETMK